jgi:dipeptidyl aminopeptidase/acylaminoacyl peptidase
VLPYPPRMTERLPYGSWPSPITAAMAVQSGIRFADVVRADGDDLYWVESRPAEGGRSVIVRRNPGDTIADVGPADFNARTRVHEYGGGSYGVHRGAVFAARFEDQRWYRIEGDTIAPITPEPEVPAGLRYADPTFGDGWMIVVRESHPAGGAQPVNELVRIDLAESSDPEVVASGHDFFAAPRLSPDGTRLAWITWDHPNMPWDGTDLWVADIRPGGDVGEPSHVAGGDSESVLQPEWGPNGTLWFTSDRTGWWNLYRYESGRITAFYPAEAEYAGPLWNLGMRRYAFHPDGRIIAIEEGTEGSRMLLIGDDTHAHVDLPYASYTLPIAVIGATVHVVATSFDTPTALISADLDVGRFWEDRRPEGPGIDPGLVSIPDPITFETPDGPAHALYYPPTNPDHRGPRGEKPPLIVSMHGGPTSRAGRALDPEKMFWTSRGFAIVDVDYGGSNGYGRAYRERLDGQWGVVDVRDCTLAASYCADHGLADPKRLVIHGGSAGGLTVLMALATTDVFAAGVVSYAVTDLEMLARDTHKFESRYLDSLVGPYPERRDLYEKRSPTHHVSEITAPLLLMQGLEDKVVPPSQAEAMRDALVANGTPVGYLAFAGEGHGFRSAATRIRALEAELWFYGEVLGFPIADEIEPVEVVGR